MKISLALLILLLAAAWTGNWGFRSSRSTCCDKYYLGKISESRIQGYMYTPSDCNLTAVLLKVRVGWLCVNRKEPWVKKYLDNQEKSNSIST